MVINQHLQDNINKNNKTLMTFWACQKIKYKFIKFNLNLVNKLLPNYVD